MEDDEETKTCACVRIDVDQEDDSACPLHGPDSELARSQRRQEAADEAAFWRRTGKWWEGD